MTRPAERSGDDPVRNLTMGVRRLIASGFHFRNVRARQLQLGTSDLAAIGHLYHDGPLTPRELGTRMEMTSGTMTALLDRVEKAGFLTRNNNPKDRRSLLITTTPAGQHAMQWVYEQFDLAVREAMTALPDVATDELDTALERLSQALETNARDDGPTRTTRPPRPDQARPHSG